LVILSGSPSPFSIIHSPFSIYLSPMYRSS
jgi:hypothetical protein